MGHPEAFGDDGLQEATGTPGIRRRVAFEEQDGYWFGHVETEPHMQSGWHHHGEMTTFGRVVEGTLFVEFGPGGNQRIEAGPGDWFRIPAGVIHREGTVGDTPGSLTLGRVGGGQPVFPVDGPEPEET